MWRLLLTALLIGLILSTTGLFVVTLQVLLLIFAGILFGVFLNGFSRWCTRHSPLSYRWSYVLVILLLALLLAGGFFYLGSQIADKASTLSSELRSSWKQLSDQWDRSRWAQQLLPDTARLKSMMTTEGGILTQVMQGLRWLGWAVTAVLVTGFVGLYSAYDPELYKTGLVKLVPMEKRPRATEVLHTLDSALGRWIIGRLFSMALVGLLTAIGLWLFGVRLPITLGVIAALLTFIPNIGPILAAVPQALLALQLGPTTALYVIIFNIVLQTVESYVITPVVQRYEVTLPPVLTIFAQLLMGVLFGIIGIVMAAPLTVVAMVLVQSLYIRDRLGDSSPGSLTAEA
jgi:predicted PurR-regulated permease PerM